MTIATFGVRILEYLSYNPLPVSTIGCFIFSTVSIHQRNERTRCRMVHRAVHMRRAVKTLRTVFNVFTRRLARASYAATAHDLVLPVMDEEVDLTDYAATSDT